MNERNYPENTHAYCTSAHLVFLQGTILIAVNPLQKVVDPEMSDFMNRSLDPEAPHPYAIAEVSFGFFFPLRNVVVGFGLDDRDKSSQVGTVGTLHP